MTDQIGDVSDAGRYRERRQLNIQTGSYYRNYRQLGQKDVLDYSYAARSAHPPKPLGGVFLILKPIEGEDGLEIEQDFASNIVHPWKPKAKRGNEQKAKQQDQDVHGSDV